MPLMRCTSMRCLRLLLVLLIAPAALAQGSDDAPFVAGLAALDVADYEEATRQLEEAVEVDPQHADAHYALALAYGADSPLRNEREVLRHLDRALRLIPDNPRYLEARLDALRRTVGEEKAFSMTDTRRPALARRILDLDSTSALAHEELALSAFLEFDWRRQLAGRVGGWDAEATRGQSGAANLARAQAEAHLAMALQTEPARESAHRLRLRIAAYARDDARLYDAAQAYAAARPDDPAAPLYVGLAAYRLNRLDEAERSFDQALAAMTPAARTAFERISLLLDADEQAAYAADSAATTERFWRARDPRLLSPQNERRLEHLARLALADLLFADPPRGERGWMTPRGEVVVRYGLPDGDGRWLASNVLAKDFGAYEQWVYGATEGQQGFTLLFEDAFRSGEYDFPSSAAGEDEATRARSLFHRTPERFAYQPPGGFVAFPHLVATFKGQDGQTDVVVPLGIPLAEDGSASTQGVILNLEAGAFLLDAEARVVAEARRQVKRLQPANTEQREATTYWAGELALEAAPGAYTLAVEFEQPRTDAVGVAREAVMVPDYSGSGLRLSSVLPAFHVEEADGVVAATQLRRGDLVIDPAPWEAFALDRPIYLYVEVYGLTPREGRTNYEVEVILKPEDQANPLTRIARRLLGRASPSGVAIRYPVEGDAADEGQYAILDASGQVPGTYLLTLRIHDRYAGTMVETSRYLELKPAVGSP